MIRVTRTQVVEFDPAESYYDPSVPFEWIQRAEQENIENEGDRYFSRGTTDVRFEKVEEKEAA